MHFSRNISEVNSAIEGRFFSEIAHSAYFLETKLGEEGEKIFVKFYCLLFYR